MSVDTWFTYTPIDGEKCSHAMRRSIPSDLSSDSSVVVLVNTVYPSNASRLTSQKSLKPQQGVSDLFGPDAIVGGLVWSMKSR